MNKPPVQGFKSLPTPGLSRVLFFLCCSLFSPLWPRNSGEKWMLGNCFMFVCEWVCFYELLVFKGIVKFVDGTTGAGLRIWLLLSNATEHIWKSCMSWCDHAFQSYTVSLAHICLFKHFLNGWMWLIRGKWDPQYLETSPVWTACVTH